MHCYKCEENVQKKTTLEIPKEDSKEEIIKTIIEQIANEIEKEGYTDFVYFNELLQANEVKEIAWYNKLEILITYFFNLLGNYSDYRYPNFFTRFLSLISNHIQTSDFIIENIEQYISFMNSLVEFEPVDFISCFDIVYSICEEKEDYSVLNSIGIDQIIKVTFSNASKTQYSSYIKVIKKYFLGQPDNIKLQEVFIINAYSKVLTYDLLVYSNQISLYLIDKKKILLEVFLGFIYPEENCPLFVDVSIDPNTTSCLLLKLLKLFPAIIENYPIPYFIDSYLDFIHGKGHKLTISGEICNIEPLCELIKVIGNYGYFSSDTFTAMQFLNDIFQAYQNGMPYNFIHSSLQLVHSLVLITIEVDTNQLDFNILLSYLKDSIVYIRNSDDLEHVLDLIIRISLEAKMAKKQDILDIINCNDISEIIKESYDNNGIDSDKFAEQISRLDQILSQE